MAFEPTPNRSNPVANAYLAPPAENGACFGPHGSCAGSGKRGSQQPAGNKFNRELRGEGSFPAQARPGFPGLGAGTGNPRSSRSPTRVLVWLVILLGLAALVLIPIVKAAWRGRRLHRVGDPRERVITIFSVFSGEAAEVGLGRSEGETIDEYRVRLERSVAFSDGHLGRLSGAAVRAAYSPRSVDNDDAVEAAADARVAIRDIRREAGIVRRVMGIYRPTL